MIIIGERINSTRAHIQEAMKAKDAAFILKEAVKQIDSGADFIDINCAMSLGDELQDIEWIINIVHNKIKDAGICLDSPNHLAIERGLKAYKGSGNLFINSITGDPARIDNIVPLAVKYNTKLIALTMGEGGMPHSAEDRIAIAKEIVRKVTAKGFKAENLYFDPLIRPISTEPEQVREFLKSVPMIKSLGVKTVCGLSNVSFGLPNRRLINSVFLAMAIESGLDAAILDPTDKYIISSIAASRALLMDDEYCADYIRIFREGRLI